MVRIVSSVFKLLFMVAGFLVAILGIFCPLRPRFWLNRHLLTPMASKVVKRVQPLRDIYLERKGNIQ